MKVSLHHRILLGCFAFLVSLSHFCILQTLLYAMCSVCAVLAGEAYFCKLEQASLVQVRVCIFEMCFVARKVSGCTGGCVLCCF